MDPFDPITDLTPPRPECVVAQDALQRLLDGIPAWDDAEAATHRATCPACREEFALARELQAHAPSLSSAVVVPAGLGPRILHASVVDRRRRRLVRMVGAGASSLAAALLLVLWLSPSHTQQIRTSHTTLVAKVDAPPKPLGATVGEARDAVVALTKRTASETRDTSVRLLPKLPDAPEPMLVSLDEPLADAQAGAVKSVRPLATSAKRALNLFLKTDRPPVPKVN